MTDIDSMQLRCYLDMIITLKFFNIKQILIATDLNDITENEQRAWRIKRKRLVFLFCRYKGCFRVLANLGQNFMDNMLPGVCSGITLVWAQPASFPVLSNSQFPSYFIFINSCS